MAKRAADSVVAEFQDLKRSRNELVAITSRDRALLESVRQPTSDTEMHCISTEFQFY